MFTRLTNERTFTYFVRSYSESTIQLIIESIRVQWNHESMYKYCTKNTSYKIFVDTHIMS